MPGRVANEAVSNTVPAGADGLAGKRGQVIWSAYDTGERLAGRIDRNSQGVPRAGSDSADGFPPVPTRSQAIYALPRDLRVPTRSHAILRDPTRSAIPRDTRYGL